MAVMIAPEEFANGMVRIKEQRGKDSEEGQGKGEAVAIDEMIEYVRGKLSQV